MTNLKTKPSTIEALKRAASQPLTSEEVERQRVSFIMGTLKENSPVTRAKVEEVLARHSGRQAKG